MPFTKWTCFLNTIHGARLSIILGQRIYPGYFIVPLRFIVKTALDPPRTFHILRFASDFNAGVVQIPRMILAGIRAILSSRVASFQRGRF